MDAHTPEVINIIFMLVMFLTCIYLVEVIMKSIIDVLIAIPHALRSLWQRFRCWRGWHPVPVVCLGQFRLEGVRYLKFNCKACGRIFGRQMYPNVGEYIVLED